MPFDSKEARSVGGCYAVAGLKAQHRCPPCACPPPIHYFHLYLPSRPPPHLPDKYKQPMKCLCASKNCRGVIGGTQEGKEGNAAAAARAAALEQAVEMPVGQEDPDFIMVTGA